MKVKKLIKLLKDFDPNAIVIVSSDAEGNKFSPMEDISEHHYKGINGWSGELVQEGEIDSEPAIVLWPVG